MQNQTKAIAHSTKILAVQTTAQPNGDYTRYEYGMPKPELLPHNHPIVLAMRYQRAENEFKGSKSALRQARKILAQSLPLVIVILKLVG